MSGMDEGSVFYSDQAQFLCCGDSDQGSLTHHSAIYKFKEFNRGFNGDKGYFSYRESLVYNPNHLTVAMDDLDAFYVVLSDKIHKSPSWANPPPS